MTDRTSDIRLRWLLAVPFATYALSYLYLAFYHGQSCLFHTVIHESGSYTLLQTMLYASHFLGHIPTLTVIALLFTGSVLTFQSSFHQSRAETSAIAISVIIFLAVTTIVSLTLFGVEDTIAYIMQQRQGAGNDVPGGSWNLHLPSLITLFTVLPPYTYITRRLFGTSVVFSSSGVRCYGLAAILVLAITALVNHGSLSPLAWIWTDPRYLAHSVRELATFPLTFFPIPLYFVLKRARSEPETTTAQLHRPMAILIVALSAIAQLLLIYQILLPLSLGIGSLAQKPAFAHGGQLGIPYLLASHYFEHVLDTIYFTLLCLLMIKTAARDPGA